jgi:hypothetical protein
MIRATGLALVLLAAGCGPLPESTVDDTESPETRTVAPLTLRAPDFTVRTSLGLIRHGRKLRVGDGVDYAFQVFEHPRRFFEFSQLPPGLQPPFEARGWESSEEGFGVIGYGQAVALALHQIERTGEGRLQLLLDVYIDEFGEADVEVRSEQVHYWFWEEDTHRLMIASTRSARGEYTLAVAVGATGVMDTLAMSPSAAREDAREAERLFRETAQAQTAGQSP